MVLSYIFYTEHYLTFLIATNFVDIHSILCKHTRSEHIMFNLEEHAKNRCLMILCFVARNTYHKLA